MRAGMAIVVALAVATSPAPAFARADPVARWRTYIDEASRRFGVPTPWIERVMQAESGGRTRIAGRPVVSRAGAMGLMQLMPGTWAHMQNVLGLGDDPHDPRDNILAGTAYLRAMYDRFGYPGLFAAYNAGPVRYAAYLGRRATLPSETRAYLIAVASRSGVELDRPREPDPGSPARRSSGVFVSLSRTEDTPGLTASTAPPTALFAISAQR